MNKIVEDYYNAREIHDNAYILLEKEVQRIVNVITTVFKQKDFWWAFKYYESGNDDSPLPKILYKDAADFPIYIDGNCCTEHNNYSSFFPISFFDMSNKDIEEYLYKEIEADRIEVERAEKQVTERAEKKRQQKNKLRDEALAKLTPEQIKALGIK
jgi:hypothetical protein